MSLYGIIPGICFVSSSLLANLYWIAMMKLTSVFYKINKYGKCFDVLLFSEESAESDITNKLEMKENEVFCLQNDLKAASEKIRGLQIEIKELSGSHYDQSDSTKQAKMLEEQHSQLKVQLRQSQLDLDSKENKLKDLTSRLGFSDSRLAKMEEFVNSQQLRIISLENTIQETEKVTLQSVSLAIISFSVVGEALVA